MKQMRSVRNFPKLLHDIPAAIGKVSFKKISIIDRTQVAKII